MNRREFQQIARIRIREAQILLSNRLYSGAYYLSGYAVECALKACIAKQVRRHDFPDRQLAYDNYTHDLKRLVRTAELEDELHRTIRSDQEFADNWAITVKWSEDSRYERVSREEALDLVTSIIDEEHGVFRWLQQFW